MQWPHPLNLFILVGLFCLAAGLAVAQEEGTDKYPGLEDIHKATLARDNVTQLIRNNGYVRNHIIQSGPQKRAEVHLM